MSLATLLLGGQKAGGRGEGQPSPEVLTFLHLLHTGSPARPAPSPRPSSPRSSRSRSPPASDSFAFCELGAGPKLSLCKAQRAPPRAAQRPGLGARAQADGASESA